MKKLDAQQRVAVLVDSENLEIAVSRHYFPPSSMRKTHLAYPDWMIIIPKIVGSRELVRSIYYKKRSLSISRKFRRLWTEELSGEFKQPRKSVDPYIIIDAVTLAEKVDVMIILAGDKDYLPLIWYLRSRGCRVEMAAFPEAASREVKTTADVFHSLSEDDTVVLSKS